MTRGSNDARSSINAYEIRARIDEFPRDEAGAASHVKDSPAREQGAAIRQPLKAGTVDRQRSWPVEHVQIVGSRLK